MTKYDDLTTLEALRALLAEARDEHARRLDLLSSGPAGGWRGGEALENAHLLERLSYLIRALEKRLQDGYGTI